MTNKHTHSDLEGLQNFLLKHSNINKKFILDFFGFQKKKVYNEYEPFTIDLDDIAYWLDARKDNLKATLVESYSKIIDFKIVKKASLPNQERLNGGQNKEIILLTPDCFKMLCMKSNTKKANDVRSYYIDLEKLIDQYKNTIIESQKHKIKVLENDLKNQDLPEKGRCYVFKEIDEFGETYYRVGRSENVKKRFDNHNSSSVHKKIVIFKIETNDIVHYEKCLRAFLYRYSYRNDFFKISASKLKKAIIECTKIVNTYKNPNFQIAGSHKNKYDPCEMIDNYMIDNYEINEEIKKMFSYMSEAVRWNLYDAPTEAYYDGKLVTETKLNELILPKTKSDKLLIVPLQRYEEYVETILLTKNAYSYKQLFEILYSHYQKQIDITFLKKVPNDSWNYVGDAMKCLQHNKNKIIKKIDIMGNLCRFEGIKKYNKSSDMYYLILGS